MNHYLNVFIESLHTASIVPMGSEPTFAAMQAFGGFNLPLAVGIAITGATLGMVFNWWLGHILIPLQNKQKLHLSDRLYDKAQYYFKRFGIFLLFFCWAPLGNLLVLTAGFLGVRFKTALPLMLFGEAAHYGFYLL